MGRYKMIHAPAPRRSRCDSPAISQQKSAKISNGAQMTLNLKIAKTSETQADFSALPKNFRLLFGNLTGPILGNSNAQGKSKSYKKTAL